MFTETLSKNNENHRKIRGGAQKAPPPGHRRQRKILRMGGYKAKGFENLTRNQKRITGLRELRRAISTMPGDRREAATKLLTEIVFLENTLDKLKESITENGK